MHWNLEKDCINSHVNLRPVIESMTRNSANKLSAFKLADHQWNLAIELKDVLTVGSKSPSTHMAHCCFPAVSESNLALLP
jgi:hypothetical protein